MTSRMRTVSPSTDPRSASGGATDFLPASVPSSSPTGLATSRWRRRAMRPTDVCHPIELRAPAPRLFPAPHATFAAGTPTESKAPCSCPGDRTFHDVRDRFGGSSCDAVSSCSGLTAFRSRAWAFSSHGAGCDRASDTPVASRRSPSRLSHLRESCSSWPYVLLLEGLVRVGGCGRSPRPPFTPPRERRRFVMIRDAFRQQGLFVGSGGHYSPGPATASPRCHDGATAG